MFPLAKWSPIRELASVQKEIDELFGRFFGREMAMPHQWLGEGMRYPAIECARKGDNLIVSVELPGIEPEEVDISVTGNLLTIRGERKHDKEVKEDDYYMREFGYGSFERAVPLPEGVNTDKIQAKYTNGVLKITMPAAAAAKAKKIKVETEEPKKKLKAA